MAPRIPPGIRRRQASSLLLIGAAGILLAACGAPSPPAPEPATLSGHLIRETCGGAAPPPGMPGCTDAPMAGVTLVFTSSTSGARPAGVQTDIHGGYSVFLLPGTYHIELQTVEPQGSGLSPNQVTVVAGQRATLDFTVRYDVA